MCLPNPFDIFFYDDDSDEFYFIPNQSENNSYEYESNGEEDRFQKSES